MATNSKDIYKRNNGIGFAVLLILIGGIFLFLNLNIIPIKYKPILISWQMLLIVMGIWCLLKKNIVGAILLIGIGGIFIYPKLTSVFPEYFADFNINIDFHTYWPLALIIVGVFLVLGKSSSGRNHSQRRSREHENDYSASRSENDIIEKNLMFGGTEQIVLSQNFRGGDLNVMFGELIVDLRKAKLAEGDNYLELNVMFGSGIIYLPSDWNVDIKSSTILGSFEDKRYQININNAENTTSKLTIKGSCMFGSGEIRD